MNTRNPHPGFAAKVASLFLVILMSLSLSSCGDAERKEKTPDVISLSDSHIAASAKGRIDIEGGVIRLAARRDGIIASVMVEEGDRVVAGQVLASLDATLAQSRLAFSQSESAQAAHEIKKASVNLKAAQREADRLKILSEINAVAGKDYDQAKDTLASAQIDIKTANAALNTAKARERVVLTEVEEHAIIAPLDGRIIQRQARPGNGVSTLNVTPLFLFMPDVPRIARVELDEQFLTVVEIGQKVEVMLDVLPDQKHQCTVLRIGQMVGQRTPTDDPQEKQDSRIVEVVISLQNQDFLIGQRVIARFIKTK